MTKSKTTKALSITLLILLSACDPPKKIDYPEVDQCMREILFKECMSLLPKGPTSVGTSNDWAEVVEECDDAAKAQSERNKASIKPECRRFND